MVRYFCLFYLYYEYIMNVAYIFVFLKNELDILEYWINYHASIVGYENIIIIDHNSDDGSKELLLHYVETKNIKLRHYYGKYENKGKIMTEEMKKYQGKCSILIPLDADEFLVTHRDNGPTFDPILIKEDLVNIINVSSRIYYDTIYNYVNTILYPSLLNLNTFVKTLYKNNKSIGQKCFFMADTFISTDMGNHCGSIRNNSSRISQSYSNNLSLLHFQMRGLNHYNNKNNKTKKQNRHHINISKLIFKNF